MTQWHIKSKRKVSGGIRTTTRRSDKKLAWKGNDPVNPTVAPTKENVKVTIAKTLGGNKKQKIARVFTATISDGKKTHKARVLSVVENKANRLFTRRNILTKGALIKVDVDGKERTAKVTSRPGQIGSLNAVFAELPKTENEGQKASKKAA